MARATRTTQRRVPKGFEPLQGSERHIRAGSRRARPAQPNEKLDVTICVRRRADTPKLPDQAFWVNTPPGRRKFLSRSDFAAAYGAASADLGRVAEFARAQGLAVVRTDLAQRVVLVSGTVAQMNAAFHVKLGQYESDTESYRGREGPIYIPTALAGIIEGIFGLDNRRMARRSSNGFSPVAAITPVQVAQDYGFPSGTASGQTLGVLEFSDDTLGTSGYAPSDVNDYFTTHLGIGPGLSAPQLKDVVANGPGNKPGGGGDTEILMDVCVAGAVAQQASINVYFSTLDENGWVLSIKEVVHPTQGETQPSVLSICWQFPEFETLGNLNWTQMAMDQVSGTLQEAAAAGITVVTASGDWGSDCQIGDGSAHVNYPYSDPWVTCVGGTEIGSEKGAYAEVTWSSTGGGISAAFSLPAWQNGVGVPPSVNPPHNAGRGIPDIAAYANGYSIVQGGVTVGPYPGTSEAAPLYAGLMALINNRLGQPVGYLNPTLYALATDPGVTGLIRDMNDGTSNAQNGAPGYTSGPGWDACTGWGVLDGGALLAYLQGIYTKSVNITTDRDHYGQDEIDAMRTQPGGAVVTGAFFVTVDGFTPTQLGIVNSSSLSAAPVVNFSPSTGVTNTCSSLESDDPTYGPEIQRFRFGYDVNFGSADTAFTSFSAMTETVTLSTVFQGLSSTAEVTFMKQPDPYIQQGPQTWWLSNDIRFIQVADGGSAFGVPMSNDPFTFLQLVTSALEGGQGKAGGQSFDDSTEEDQEVLTVAPQNAAKQNVYNFAIARVHYQALATPANNVRVFFRLFAANSTATDFQPTSTYERYAAYSPNYPVPLADYGQNVISTPGVSGADYISMPFYGVARADPTQSGAPNSLPSQQSPDSFNVRTLGKTGGPVHDTFFGCWLDINQVAANSTSQLPNAPPAGNVDGPWPAGSGVTLEPIQQAFIVNEHQCLVAEIAFDPDPINTGTQPWNSDKLAQRNISWSYVANPGAPASRRAIEPFEVRPTPASVSPSESPDELMIDWTNVPIGQQASIYLPNVNVNEVLSMAGALYVTQRLTRVDAHTIGCRTGGVSYIPLPKGSGDGTNFVGLLSIDLPAGIVKGQKYTVIVRQVTNASGLAWPPPPPVLIAVQDPGVGTAPTQLTWRRVLGTFQVNIPVSTKELMLPREEQRLSIFRWIGETMPKQRRWYLVFQRYLQLIAERVGALGGDPSRVLPSPTGDWAGTPVLQPTPGDHRHHGHMECTGKVEGLIFDGFGDFEGFLLEADEGKHKFLSREAEIKQLVETAWRERLRITVWTLRHEPHRPTSIVVRQPPAPFSR
jgi:hypothetical protein